MRIDSAREARHRDQPAVSERMVSSSSLIMAKGDAFELPDADGYGPTVEDRQGLSVDLFVDAE